MSRTPKPLIHTSTKSWMTVLTSETIPTALLPSTTPELPRKSSTDIIKAVIEASRSSYFCSCSSKPVLPCPALPCPSLPRPPFTPLICMIRTLHLVAGRCPDGIWTSCMKKTSYDCPTLQITARRTDSRRRRPTLSSCRRCTLADPVVPLQIIVRAKRICFFHGGEISLLLICQLELDQPAVPTTTAKVSEIIVRARS
jgi:hypothetical protein